MGAVYFALDPGTLRNSFALAGVRRCDAEDLETGEIVRDVAFSVVALRQWDPTPGQPIDVRMREGPAAARIVRAIGGDVWATDAHELAAVRLTGNDFGIQTVHDTSDVWEQWRHLTAPLARGRIALGLPPRRTYVDENGEERAYVEPDDLEALKAQLRGILRKPGEAGRFKVHIPEDGQQHGDLARAFARALWLAKAADVRPPGPPVPAHKLGIGYRVDGPSGRVRVPPARRAGVARRH